MYTCMRFGRWLSCIAAIAMIASPLVAAEKASHQAKAGKVFDVAISKHGKLIGQLVTTAGQPRAQAEVVAVSHNKVVAKTQTDARGVFQLPVPAAGVYQISLAERTITIRAWKAELAPPSTRESLLCVTQDGTMRGQSHMHHGLGSLLTNPLFIGLGIAAAVAIPIAIDEIDDDDDDELPSAS